MRRLAFAGLQVRSKPCVNIKWYALWAWGGPAVVVGVTLAMQYLPPSYTRGAKLPGVGLEGTCFLGSEGALYYLHMINLPILMSNIVLFTLR